MTDTQRELDETRAAGRRAESEAHEYAANSRIAERHSALLTLLKESAPPYQAARAQADSAARWRRTSLETLEKLTAAWDKADQRHASAREQVDRLDSVVADADARVQDSEREAAAQGAALVAASRSYFRGTQEVLVADADSLVAQLETWVENLDGGNPVTQAVTVVVAETSDQLGRHEGECDALERDARKRLNDVEAQLRELAEGHQPPPAHLTIDQRVRLGKAGAPLWRVVDFADGLPEADRAGLEASLQASGLLDAWIYPDGALRSAADGDVIMLTGQPLASNLGELLIPAVDTADPQASALTDKVILAALSSIGLQRDSGAHTWVTTIGEYQIGRLAGRWSKASAEFVGEGAREQARRQRQTQLREERDGLLETLDGIVAQKTQLRARRARLLEEQALCPSDAPLRDAFAHVRAERDARRRHLADLEGARVKARQTADEATKAHNQTAEFAADVDLPIHREGVTAVKEALQAYRVALSELWHTATNEFEAARRLAKAQTVLAETEERLAHLQAEGEEATQQALAARDRYEALNDTVGASVAQLQDRLAANKSELDLNRTEIGRAASRERHALETRGLAKGKQEILTGDLVNAGLARDAAVDSLRSFAASGLLRMACPGLDIPDASQPWAATPAVLLARAADRELSNVDDSDAKWDRSQQHVANDFKTLNDNLGRRGHRAEMTPRDDIMLVDVIFQNRQRTVNDLAVALAEEIEERQRVLSAREREVLENHLVNEIAGTLQELITGAETQVARMNEELERRPTSTGMRLRLRWRSAKGAPEGLSDLRSRQLRQSIDVWNDEDRRKVGAFLQELINRERERDEAATWHEQLTRALDYRAWHDFAIERYQDGAWRPATGPASGGERVLAASMPLFAAVSSYYSSASRPTAPRLIALDEAFAGVDDDSRAKCLGLLATFDLDVVMTSEREWGCYPQVPGLAIAQLSRHDEIDAVLVTPWRWDGSERVRVPRPTVAQVSS